MNAGWIATNEGIRLGMAFFASRPRMGSLPQVEQRNQAPEHEIQLSRSVTFESGPRQNQGAIGPRLRSKWGKMHVVLCGSDDGDENLKIGHVLRYLIAVLFPFCRKWQHTTFGNGCVWLQCSQ